MTRRRRGALTSGQQPPAGALAESADPHEIEQLAVGRQSLAPVLRLTSDRCKRSARFGVVPERTGPGPQIRLVAHAIEHVLPTRFLEQVDVLVEVDRAGR